MGIKIHTNIELGWRVQDTITGFKGIATSIAKFLNGCERIAITPEELKDGKTLDTEYFDVQQLIVLDKKPGKTAATKTPPTGGPYPAPTRERDPK